MEAGYPLKVKEMHGGLDPANLTFGAEFGLQWEAVIDNIRLLAKVTQAVRDHVLEVSQVTEDELDDQSYTMSKLSNLVGVGPIQMGTLTVFDAIRAASIEMDGLIEQLNPTKIVELEQYIKKNFQQTQSEFRNLILNQMTTSLNPIFQLFNSLSSDPKKPGDKLADEFHRIQQELNALQADVCLEKFHSDDPQQEIPHSAIVIKCDAQWGDSKRDLTWNQRKVLFENCGEAHCINSSHKRADPFLVLFYDCQVPSHVQRQCRCSDVAQGIANGTTAKFKRAIFKPGKHPTKARVHNFWIFTASIHDIACLKLAWFDCRYNGTFRLSAKKERYTVRYPFPLAGKQQRIPVAMDLTCFPLVLNHATTCHKLQGKSLDKLIVSEWCKMKNWAYVMLSRVRTLAGLSLAKPLPANLNLEPDPQYLPMMDRLHNTILATPDDFAEDLTDDQHDINH